MSEMMYNADHLWFLETGNTLKIGMTDYLKSKILPDFIRISQPGRILTAGESLGVLESNKFTCDIVVPFSCEVLERNEKLLEYPALIGQQPENQNWFCVVKVNSENWSADLMDNEEYMEYIEP